MIQGLEWLLLVIIIVIVIVIWRYISWRRDKVTESVILSIIRSKNGATIDDLIIGAHISADKAYMIVRKLIAKGVIKVGEREGRTIYLPA